MSARSKEWISIGVMLVIPGLFYAYTPDNPEYGASIFPVVIMWLMLALIGIKAVSMLVFAQDGEKKAQGDPPRRGRLWGVMAALTAYVLLVEVIGFYVTSFLFFFGTTLAVQTEERTPRCIAVRFAVVTGLLLFIYVLFTKVLMAQLPEGLLF